MARRDRPWTEGIDADRASIVQMSPVGLMRRRGDRAEPARQGHAAGDFVAICADGARFRRWYDDALPRVYSYLFLRTGGDHALTEDLTQQAFLRAIRARATYDGRAPIAAWI